MKLYDLCDLFSIFNLTAQKLITFPKRFCGNGRMEAGSDTKQTRVENDKVSSVFGFKCVCVRVRLSLKRSRLISFFPFSFWLFVLCVFLPQSASISISLCLTLCANACLNYSLYISQMESVCCCKYYTYLYYMCVYAVLPHLLNYVCVCFSLWWLQCEQCRVMKTHFYHLPHAASFIYIAKTHKNTDEAMWDFGNRQLSENSAKWEKNERKHHANSKYTHTRKENESRALLETNIAVI